MSAKPFLFLDVDGVVAPFGNRPEWPKQFVGVAIVPIVPENHERLAVLDDVFEIVWCTDWMEHANELGEIYGLAPRPYLEIPEGKYSDSAHYEIEDESGIPSWESDPYTRPEDLVLDRSYGSHSLPRKLKVVTKFLSARENQSRPFAWVDDHVNFEARRFAANWRGSAIAIRTNREAGLSKSEYEQLMAFASSFSRRQL
ncbi:MAG: HAD domain-containing protein [Solirubrobacterales bacterium]